MCVMTSKMKGLAQVTTCRGRDIVVVPLQAAQLVEVITGLLSHIPRATVAESETWAPPRHVAYIFLSFSFRRH